MIRKLCILIILVTLFLSTFWPEGATRQVEARTKRRRIYLPLVVNDVAPPRQLQARTISQQIVELANEQRATAGLAPLAVNAILMNEAQRFSAVQAEIGKLSHRGIDGTDPGQRLITAGYLWSYCGETLAAGQRTAGEVVAAWMNSPPHRAIMLSPEAAEVGIGHSIRAGEPNGTVNYFVMEVGRPR